MTTAEGSYFSAHTLIDELIEIIWVYCNNFRLSGLVKRYYNIVELSENNAKRDRDVRIEAQIAFWVFAKLLAVKLFPIFPLQTGKNTPTIDDIILIF